MLEGYRRYLAAVIGVATAYAAYKGVPLVPEDWAPFTQAAGGLITSVLTLLSVFKPAPAKGTTGV